MDFDVIVIGGGHAGTEAAAASARRGARTALLSFDLTKLGAMSCNPAIGGLGKGHLVREVDAFDGLMGRATDAAGIHYRMLNRSKGTAAQGPRYCPSIEDKIHRFGDRDGHQIFLEPEGLDTHLIYPNGMSTSLPVDVQMAMVNSIPGLERTVIVTPGYAVEYDHIDPRALDATLALPAIPGLWCAGQINGTTGYEEAAGQGLVAGLNAAAHAQELAPLILDRATSYLGVMVDDLVLQGVTEPYRMLTARAEFRLRLRADNAGSRLGPIAAGLGCLGAERLAWLQAREQGRARLDQAFAAERTASALAARGATVAQDGARRPAREWLRFPGIELAHLDIHSEADPDLLAEYVEDARYAPYLERQEAEVAQLRANDAVKLPAGMDFAAIAGLSNEMVEKLSAARPETIGAAARIRGITPAALSAILLHAKRRAA